MSSEARSQEELIATIRQLEGTVSQLIQKEQIKIETQKKIEVLVGGITHDFGNIITSLISNLSLARRMVESSHAIVPRLEKCEKAAEQAGKLARQLLTLTVPIAKSTVDPASLIQDAVSFVLDGSHVGSAIELADDLGCIDADAGELGRALHNLLLNAVQAMPYGGVVTVKGSNEKLDQDNPHRLPPGDYVKIAVIDQGDGIPPEHLVKIFTPYFTTKHQGVGLGLTSVLFIVKKYGGHVGASSTVGSGSRFEIYLPASCCR